MSDKKLSPKIDHWCHQILKHEDKDGNVWFGLHEVYKDYLGNILSYTRYPVIVGDTAQEVIRELNLMRNDAVTKSVARAIHDPQERSGHSLMQALEELLEGADDTGCEGDVIVVNLSAIKTIYRLTQGELALEQRWPN